MDLRKIKLVIVDDEEDLREILKEDFESLGATVWVGKNGREAFELVTQHQPDVILSDVRMPGGDGVELLKRVREAYPKAPPHLFLLTGFADITPEQATQMGCAGLLAKPFNLKLLRETVFNITKK